MPLVNSSSNEQRFNESWLPCVRYLCAPPCTIGSYGLLSSTGEQQSRHASHQYYRKFRPINPTQQWRSLNVAHLNHTKLVQPAKCCACESSPRQLPTTIITRWEPGHQHTYELVSHALLKSAALHHPPHQGLKAAIAYHGCTPNRFRAMFTSTLNVDVYCMALLV